MTGSLPAELGHAAVAAPYAHVTAPLRRLVDRFGLVACEHHVRNAEVPSWVVDALPTLPEAMAVSGRRASAVERACADATEAAVLSDRVGESFAAVVVDVAEKGMIVQLVDAPILGLAGGERRGLGASVQVRLERADIAAGIVGFHAG